MRRKDRFQQELKAIKDRDCIKYPIGSTSDIDNVYNALRDFYKSLQGKVPFTEPNNNLKGLINESLKDFNPKEKNSFKNLEFTKQTILKMFDMLVESI